MRLLLDTSTFLWIASDSSQLSERVRGLFQDPTTEVFLSVISAWEIALKYALGKLELESPPQLLIPEQRTIHGIESLPLAEAAVYQLHRLPALHRDPFDRMLICQAIVGGFTLATPDRLIFQYPVATVW